MPSVPRTFASIFIAVLSCLLVPVAAHAARTGGTAYTPPAPKPKAKAAPTTAPVTPPAAATDPADPTADEELTVPEPGFWTGPEVPGTKAKLLADGTASAPADAPDQVKQAIWAANWLQDKPYSYGGGHREFVDDGYDCSGTVSFALHAAALLDSPLPSGPFMRWGAKGKGAWFTVYTNPGHAYVVVAGLRLDTSAAGVRMTKKVSKAALESGPRWRPTLRATRGFVRRHPVGF
jgi:cell wall-associated NlpC family hydrolase